MTHVYGNVRGFQDWLRDNGSSDLGSDLDELLLGRLRTASSAVDRFCDRGPSGFGPVTATRRYEADGSWELELRDDLLSVTSIITRDWNGTVAATFTTNDYYLEPLNKSPKREICLLPGGVSDFGAAWVDVTGTFGYSNDTTPLVAILSGAIDTDDTPIILSGDPDVSAGQTIVIGSEQMFVRRVEGTVVTVDRGVNGTAAASHADQAAISTYVYHPDVVEATYAVAARRMRTRDAGLIPDYGNQQAVVGPRDTERSLLRATVGHLRVYE